jgi:STAS-like domain of unknown function (DUF4325)
MEAIKISVLSNFSKTPGPRFIKEGHNSGEQFRNEVLEVFFKKAVAENRKLEVNLDGTVGYATSFLEEAFGGLARIYGSDKVLAVIEIISTEEEYYKDEVLEYIKDANEKS